MRNAKNTKTDNLSQRNIFSRDESRGRPLRQDPSLAIFELNKSSADRPASRQKRPAANDWSVQELDSLEDRASTQMPPQCGRSATSSIQQMYQQKPTESKSNGNYFKHNGAPKIVSYPA